MKKRRLDQGLLRREVAERLGVHETSIYNWESGRHAPSAQFAARIRVFLGAQHNASSVRAWGDVAGLPVPNHDASDLIPAAEL